MEPEKFNCKRPLLPETCFGNFPIAKEPCFLNRINAITSNCPKYYDFKLILLAQIIKNKLLKGKQEELLLIIYKS